MAAPGSSGGTPPPRRGVLGFLRAHPILCLALLTPGLPEYLSTSSPVLNIALNPAWFFLQMAVNVGQYTAGALLIREAVLRWRKGWATAVLLSLAYGIMEEGLGDNTLFNSNQGADGVLGSFGRFQGVNWVWSTGVLTFHALYSIGLPLVLLGLALPWTRGRPLLGRRGIALAFASVVATTSFETVLVYGRFHFWMGPYLLAGSAVAIVALVAVARWVPGDAWRPSREGPTLSPSGAFALGFAVFPGLFLLEYGGAGLWAPAAAVIGLELLFLVGLSEVVRRGIGRTNREYVLVHVAFGLVAWQATFGLLLTLGLPYNLPLVVLAIYFLWRLRRAHAPTPPSPGPGPGAPTAPYRTEPQGSAPTPAGPATGPWGP